jgi:hypothetical protein
VVDFITSPVRPCWGEYREGNARSTPYLTVFGTSDNGALRNLQDFRTQFTNVLTSSADDPLQDIYGSIYSSATTGLPAIVSYCDDVVLGTCPYAQVAKNAAFVCLIGLNDTGAALTSIQREGFRQKASSVIYGMHYALEKSDDKYDEAERQLWRARELICLLQAHDLLKYAKLGVMRV